MTDINRDELIRTALGAVRAPFAIADMQIVRFRGKGSRVRFVPQTALGLIDALAAHLAPDASTSTARPEAAPTAPKTDETPDTAADEAPAADETADAAAGSEPEVELSEEREEQLAAERKAREHKATRSNKSVAAMARDLAVAEAVADAHEERAREQELTAKDFGPQGS